MLYFPVPEYPFLLGGVPLDVIGRKFFNQPVVFKPLQGKLVPGIGLVVKILNKEIHIGRHLHVHIALVKKVLVIEILHFKCQPRSIGLRNDPSVEDKTDDGNYRGADKIRKEQSSETYATAQNGDDFGVGSHARRHVHNRYKNRDGGDQSCNPGNKIKIISENRTRAKIVF